MITTQLVPYLAAESGAQAISGQRSPGFSSAPRRLTKLERKVHLYRPSKEGDGIAKVVLHIKEAVNARRRRVDSWL
jgi:hypothetical protein